MEVPYKPTAITLKTVPEDVYKIIMGKQTEIKQARGINMFSMEKTIYMILQEWEELRPKLKK